jgi:hypothetical protein
LSYVLIPYVIPTIVAVAAVLVWAVFIIRYHVSTHGEWRRSAIGRNVMNSSFVIISLVLIAAATRLATNGATPEPFIGQRYFATAAYLFAVFSGVQRIVLQYRAQRDDRNR